MKHQALRSKADLRRVGISPKRIWLRITNPASSKRRLSHQSKVFLRYWQQWAQMPFFSRPLAMPPRWLPDAFAADACASGNKIGIGGFIKMGDAPAVWFSEVFSLRSLQKLISDLPSVAQEAITCWETLAQMGLVLLLASCFPGGRLKICVPSWCDNTGAESTSNKLFCTSLPLAFFAQKLSLLSWHTGISLDVHHVAGFENTIADHLSRWMEGHFSGWVECLASALSDLWWQLHFWGWHSTPSASACIFSFHLDSRFLLPATTRQKERDLCESSAGFILACWCLEIGVG